MKVSVVPIARERDQSQGQPVVDLDVPASATLADIERLAREQHPEFFEITPGVPWEGWIASVGRCSAYDDPRDCGIPLCVKSDGSVYWYCLDREVTLGELQATRDMGLLDTSPDRIEYVPIEGLGGDGAPPFLLARWEAFLPWLYAAAGAIGSVLLDRALAALERRYRTWKERRAGPGNWIDFILSKKEGGWSAPTLAILLSVAEDEIAVYLRALGFREAPELPGF